MYVHRKLIIPRDDSFWTNFHYYIFDMDKNGNLYKTGDWLIMDKINLDKSKLFTAVKEFYNEIGDYSSSFMIATFRILSLLFAGNKYYMIVSLVTQLVYRWNVNSVLNIFIYYLNGKNQQFNSNIFLG